MSRIEFEYPTKHWLEVRSVGAASHDAEFEHLAAAICALDKKRSERLDQLVAERVAPVEPTWTEVKECRVCHNRPANSSQDPTRCVWCVNHGHNSVSELCRATGQQDCCFCEDYECGDNMNDAAKPPKEIWAFPGQCADGPTWEQDGGWSHVRFAERTQVRFVRQDRAAESQLQSIQGKVPTGFLDLSSSVVEAVGMLYKSWRNVVLLLDNTPTPLASSVDDLADEVKRVLDEKDQKSKELQEKLDQVYDLHDAIAAELELVRHESKRKVESLQAVLTETNANVAKAMRVLGPTGKDLDGLIDRAKWSREQVDRLREERDEARAACNELRRLADSAETAVESAQEERDLWEKQRDEARRAFTACDEQREANQRAAEAAEKRLAEVELERDEVRVDILRIAEAVGVVHEADGHNTVAGPVDEIVREAKDNAGYALQYHEIHGEVDRLRQERDEARAEAERLRALWRKCEANNRDFAEANVKFLRVLSAARQVLANDDADSMMALQAAVEAYDNEPVEAKRTCDTCKHRSISGEVYPCSRCSEMHYEEPVLRWEPEDRQTNQENTDAPAAVREALERAADRVHRLWQERDGGTACGWDDLRTAVLGEE